MTRSALALLVVLAGWSLVLGACGDARQSATTGPAPAAPSGVAAPGVPATPAAAEAPPEAAPAPTDRAPPRAAASIGAATMEADGTIVLQLRAETGATVGDALLRYPPSHERYAEIRAHVGPREPGLSRPVPPFPADAGREGAAAPSGALPPIELDCAVDADCALSDVDLVGDACCPGCLTEVVNTRWKQRAEAYCAAHPGHGCPRKRCGEVAVPRCSDGACTNDP